MSDNKIKKCRCGRIQANLNNTNWLRHLERCTIMKTLKDTRSIASFCTKKPKLEQIFEMYTNLGKFEIKFLILYLIQSVAYLQGKIREIYLPP